MHKAIVKAKAIDKEVVRNVDEAYIIDLIVSGKVNSRIIDNGLLLVFDAGSPWYTKRVFVEECLVLRIGKGGTLDDVCDLLDDLADIMGADCIYVGGGLAVAQDALIRMYKARGFTDTNSFQLIKRRN